MDDQLDEALAFPETNAQLGELVNRTPRPSESEFWKEGMQILASKTLDVGKATHQFAMKARAVFRSI